MKKNIVVGVVIMNKDEILNKLNYIKKLLISNKNYHAQKEISDLIKKIK